MFSAFRIDRPIVTPDRERALGYRERALMSQKTLQNRATDVWAGVAVILRPRCSRRITIASSGRSAGRPVQHDGQPARWTRGRSVERVHEEAAAVRDVVRKRGRAFGQTHVEQRDGRTHLAADRD